MNWKTSFAQLAHICHFLMKRWKARIGEIKFFSNFIFFSRSFPIHSSSLWMSANNETNGFFLLCCCCCNKIKNTLCIYKLIYIYLLIDVLGDMRCCWKLILLFFEEKVFQVGSKKSKFSIKLNFFHHIFPLNQHRFKCFIKRNNDIVIIASTHLNTLFLW